MGRLRVLNIIIGQHWIHAVSRISEKDGKLYINFNNMGYVEFEQIGQLVYRYSSPFFRFPVEIGFYRDESNKVAYLRNIWRTWIKIE